MTSKAGSRTSGRGTARLYILHGVPVRTELEVPSWFAIPPDGESELDPWTLTVRGVEATQVSMDLIRAGPTRMRWDGTRDSGTSHLTLSGGEERGGPVTFTLDWARRELSVDLAGGATAAGVLDLVSRWMVPEISARERGSLALHGTAIQTPGGTVVVCGPSGAGKSTLSAALVSNGGRVISDEPAVITTDAGKSRLWQGGSPLRLTDPAIPAVIPAGHSLVGTDSDGKHLLAPDIPALEPHSAVSAVLLLAPRRRGSEPVIMRRLRGGAAISRLMAQRYVRVTDPELTRSAFTAAARVARSVAILDATVSDDLGLVGEAAAAIVDALDADPSQ